MHRVWTEPVSFGIYQATQGEYRWLGKGIYLLCTLASRLQCRVYEFSMRHGQCRTTVPTHRVILPSDVFPMRVSVFIIAN